MELPFAEKVNYWKTGNSSPDVWIEKSKREIEIAGGIVLREAFGSESTTGREAYMLEFSFGGEVFKLIWPVLPSEYGETKAARRQAATMLYHDVKSRCVAAKVLGNRSAFFNYLMLPDGSCVSQLANNDLARQLPDLMQREVKAIESR